MSLASVMADIDLTILKAVGEVVLFNGSKVYAAFQRGPRVESSRENPVETLILECYCRKSDLPTMNVDDPVVVGGVTYRFLAQEPPDEAGLCCVRLGS